MAGPQIAYSRAEEPGGTQATDLLALARSRTLPDRKKLVLGVIAMCEAAPPGPEQQALLGDIFLTLMGQAERDIRRILAERLAPAEWAPRALINTLALDEIDIARPVIAASPLLRDQELLRILIEATVEHQIAVARRPGLSDQVIDAIIDGGVPAVLTALATNHNAQMAEASVRRLVEHSRRIAALRAPLVRHPAITTRLAEALHGWGGQALREALGDKRGIGRYGFTLPMDETQASCALDFSGRPYLVFRTEFKPEKVGDLPTELVEHFWRSLCDASGMNLHLTVEGDNDHHKIEAGFKAFARALRQSIARAGTDLPSTKGAL